MQGFTFPLSISLVVKMMIVVFSCQIIFQKSFTVVGRQSCVAMYLHSDPSVVGSDYINASYISGEIPGSERVCIGAQDMCTRYWPSVKQEETYGKVQVKNLKETSNPHYILREFLVHHEEVRRCVVVCVCLVA